VNDMSETQSAVQVAAYLIMMIPSVYFLYMILKAVYIHFTTNDEDIL
jgi:hypothetical protein